MGLKIGISTSSHQFKVVFGENGKVLFDSEKESDSIEHPRFMDHIVKLGLEKINRKAQDIEEVIVDIGPGGTSRVRSGVSYAYGLAYGLDVPLSSVTSMEMMGIEAWENHGVPVACVINSVKENIYLGLFDGQLNYILYGDINELFQKLVNEHQKIVLAGNHREKLLELFPNHELIDSQIEFGGVACLIEKNEKLELKTSKYPNFPIPITENSLPKYERT